MHLFCEFRFIVSVCSESFHLNICCCSLMWLMGYDKMHIVQHGRSIEEFMYRAP
ncbi:hypothetical protein HanXRQr2_Chr01g0033011 [Helianthus annuus]|uniref:Uncharacterized protein n=1 Tax=Helianthus annuus TaxID=4232 RepID=A0A251SK32_HELAN|nr:hypothetical protein HanXRQr2_Chr01g0033011 [Helianthus annuus]